MADWLDDYSSFGVKLSEGDKVLMRFAIAKERERIIKLLEGEMCEKDAELVECWCGSWLEAIALIKGENK